jgi:ParB family chromosome partitioning protein
MLTDYDFTHVKGVVACLSTIVWKNTLIMSHPGFLQEIEASKIHHPQNQLRTGLDNVHDLAISIQQHGLLQPIVVRPRQHQYEVVAGNRRLAAIRLLRLRKISCHVVELSDKEAYEVALVENIQHKTLNPIEEAVAFNQYVESFGWGGISELARRIGKSQEFVTKRIQLLRLPERVKEEIIRQRMTPSVALEMLPLEKEAMEEFADFIIKNPLTKDEVRHIIRVSKEEHNGNDDSFENAANYGGINSGKELYLLDKALRKSIAVMKSTLVNFDDIVNNVNDEWVLKELLMQYRLIIHGDIDTFLKLRKRLARKVPKEYFRSKDQNKMVKIKAKGTNENSLRDNDVDDNNSSPSIHIWTANGIWQ